MKKLLGLILVVVILSSMLINTVPSLVFAASDGSLGDTNIKYEGRWDFSNTSQYASYWCGAYIKVNF